MNENYLDCFIYYDIEYSDKGVLSILRRSMKDAFLFFNIKDIRL